MDEWLKIWDLFIVAHVSAAVLPVSFVGLRMNWKVGQLKAITQNIDETGMKALRFSMWLWLLLAVHIAVRLAYHWSVG